VVLEVTVGDLVCDAVNVVVVEGVFEGVLEPEPVVVLVTLLVIVGDPV
jgi:hypothetical protein